MQVCKRNDENSYFFLNFQVMFENKEHLLAGLRKKDTDAYKELFFRYHGRLVLFARKFTGDLEAAQDIVQDAFLTLWEKSDLLMINISPKAYLFQAVRNRALNYNRHTQVKQNVHNGLLSKIDAAERVIYSDSDDPFCSLLELEMEQKIEVTISAMPEKCREIFVMSRQDNLKNREIAEKMGITVKMVEKQMSKALRILRTQLSEYVNLFLIILLTHYFL